jgi:F0F1-type ATP synthase membrane subunit c/vacuolar-type H+-ATPase subunit K
MYGMNTAIPASGAALAYTGLNVGAGLLTALGILLIGVALIALVRRNPSARP